MGATSSPQQQDNEPATSTANGPGSDVVGRKKSVQNLRRMLSKPWAWIAGFAIIAVVVILAAALSNIDPLQALVPAPALAPAAATPVGASSVATVTPGKPFQVSTALLSPADLTFTGIYPVANWHRCDDYSVDRKLERYRAAYKVTGSAAAIWEYGSGCGNSDQKAQLDEYAWLLKSAIAAAELNDALNTASILGNLPPASSNQVRQFERDSVIVRTLDIESGGQRRYAAEIIGQAGSAVVSIRMTTEAELTDEDYLGLARLCLDRMRAGQSIH
jgi:hypothetical protein